MTNQPVCCVCGTPLTPPISTIHGRAYCAHHFALVNRPSPSFWRAGLVEILGIVALCALIALVANFLPPLNGTPLIIAGLVIALLPTILWLVFFYQQDRLEPEPKTSVLLVFLLALLLADVLGVRLVRDWLRVADWGTQDTFTSLLASTLVLGFTYQIIAFLAVRLTVYTTPEFDERMDGIVYGTVAGLGVATLLNLRYIIDNGGVALGPGVVRVATTTLAMASFSGLMGYFMAEAKFDTKPVWWVPAGVALAATLNGLFSWLIVEVSSTGLTVDPWRSLLLGLVVALAVFAVLVVLMRRVTTVTLARKEQV
ncbi:MAG: PrsW family intramembrane metalloprotease [Roseiflexaceae bacterium]|nr:PrsW family intramembrane metalloprotease [Roseiflexaceae bacterium]